MRDRTASVLILAALVMGCGRSANDSPPPAAHTASDSTSKSATPAPAPDSTSAAAAAAVIRDYYAAIEARDYRRAYAAWSNGGQASGQSFEAFAAGFAKTAHVTLELGAPGRVEGAAGSRYIEIPAVVEAITTDGKRQRFEGGYVLRRSVVEGASDDQRRWRIHSASLRRAS